MPKQLCYNDYIFTLRKLMATLRSKAMRNFGLSSMKRLMSLTHLTLKEMI